MIYPDVEVTEWVKQYPALEGGIRCIGECAAIRKPAKPWISKDLVGIETSICESCGRPPAFKYNYRCRKRNQQMINMVGI